MSIMVIISDMNSAIIIIDFEEAPDMIIIIGPSDTFGILFSIVKYGSNTLCINLYLQSIAAIIMPNDVLMVKLIRTSYNVVKIWWKSDLSLYNVIIVSIIFFGLDEINVLIKLLFAAICHVVMINVINDN